MLPYLLTHMLILLTARINLCNSVVKLRDGVFELWRQKSLALKITNKLHEIMTYSGTCVLWTPWDQPKCPDYQGVLIFQVSLHDHVSFGTTARRVDYVGVHIF